MASQTINILKGWFSTGKKPVQQQFWDWFDSFWHKSEDIPIAKIAGLQAQLDALSQNSSGGNNWNYQKVSNVNGTTITISIPIPTNNQARKIMVFREGVKIRFTDDFTISGNSFELNQDYAASGETFEIFTQL